MEVKAIGVLVIVVGLLAVSVAAVVARLRREPLLRIYRQSRSSFGRVLLLGIEFLVAGDIIRTVAVDLTFTSVGVLGLLVAVRTFLSFTLELEIEGRWPWQQREERRGVTGAGPISSWPSPHPMPRPAAASQTPAR